MSRRRLRHARIVAAAFKSNVIMLNSGRVQRWLAIGLLLRHSGVVLLVVWSEWRRDGGLT